MSQDKDSSNSISHILFVVTAGICVLFAVAAFYFILPNRETWMVGLPQASSYARDIDGLFGLITFLVGFWFIVSEGVFFYLIFRFRRKSPDQKAQYISGEEPHQKQWISIPHILVILCDIVLIVGTVFVWYKVKQDLPDPPDRQTIRVTGQQWAWTFQHPGKDGELDTEDDVILVDELHLKVNTVYHFKLESKDVLHSFSIPAFRIKQDSLPGREITGWFEPIIPGEYDIQCAEMCGIGHGLMWGRLYVHTEEEFNQWQEEMNPSSTVAVKTSQTPPNQVALGGTDPGGK
jgi:cytochrome c oxidase subunit 2|tara:strand:- start:1769 stop:2638 length:870 start_codon:yes stop_codon:yes gene_type:complete